MSTIKNLFSAALFSLLVVQSFLKAAGLPWSCCRDFLLLVGSHNSDFSCRTPLALTEPNSGWDIPDGAKHLPGALKGSWQLSVAPSGPRWLLVAPSGSQWLSITFSGTL